MFSYCQIWQVIIFPVGYLGRGVTKTLQSHCSSSQLFNNKICLGQNYLVLWAVNLMKLQLNKLLYFTSASCFFGRWGEGKEEGGRCFQGKGHRLGLHNLEIDGLIFLWWQLSSLQWIQVMNCCFLSKRISLWICLSVQNHTSTVKFICNRKHINGFSIPSCFNGEETRQSSLWFENMIDHACISVYKEWPLCHHY